MTGFYDTWKDAKGIHSAIEQMETVSSFLQKNGKVAAGLGGAAYLFGLPIKKIGALAGGKVALSNMINNFEALSTSSLARTQLKKTMDSMLRSNVGAAYNNAVKLHKTLEKPINHIQDNK